MSSSQSGISSNNLILYLKALRNYKQTGYIKSMAIIKYMNGITLTPPQVNLVLPGAWILVVGKIEPRDLHEREMKTEVLSFLHKLNQQYKERKGEILSEMIQKSKERAMKRGSEEIKRISITVQDVGSA